MSKRLILHNNYNFKMLLTNEKKMKKKMAQHSLVNIIFLMKMIC